MVGFWEYQEDGTKVRVTLRGRFLGWEEDEVTPIMELPTLSETWVPAAYDPDAYKPLSPSLTVEMTTRTSTLLTITKAVNLPPRSAIDEYDIYRAQDTGEFTFQASVPRTQTTWADPEVLPTNTPEIIWRSYVVARNVDGITGYHSNNASAQWEGVIVQQPFPPYSAGAIDIQGDRATITWDYAEDDSVDKQGLFKGTELLVDNIPANDNSYVWTGLTSDTVYNNLNVRRHNNSGIGFLPGWSVASNSFAFVTGHGPLTALYEGHVRGKIVFGWSTDNADSFSENQLNTLLPKPAGAPSSYSDYLGVKRVYNKTADASGITWADTRNRMVWLSTKPGDLGATGSGTAAQWLNLASGARDSNIINYFNSIVARDKLTLVSFHHEPIGDITLTEQASDFISAFKHIIQLVDGEYPGHKILWAPNFEENRLRNLRSNTSNVVDWSLWCPEDMMPGRSDYAWDLITFDMYQYGNANISSSPKQGVQFSHRWWRIDELFAGTWRPNGTSEMPWMDFTPGVDLVYGLGECAARAELFYNWETNPTGTAKTSDMTGAKYARDMLDYIFTNLDKFGIVCWWNTLGTDYDNRLYPDGNIWNNENPGHPDLTVQTGDTELTMNIYREKLSSGVTIKLDPATGMPVGWA
jgi:hypothetical protein